MRLKRLLNLFNKSRRSEYFEAKRLSRLPRRTTTHAKFFGANLEIPDAASFLVMRKEILKRGIYSFKTLKTNPRILDGGANIGFGVLFFKQRWPMSKITAFEPDRAIFSILERNIKSAGVPNVHLVNKALWSANGEISFHGDGADGGRITAMPDERKNVVPTARLRDFLDEEIDLLKLDIEGAELEVLLDAADRLHTVRNLFVECHSFTNRTQNLDQVLSLLRANGFRYFVEPVIPCAQPFIERPIYEEMDLQVNVHASRDWL